MFKVNDKVVYKGHGVCTVKRIETKTVGAKSMQFYILNTVYALTLFVPVNTDQLRPIASKAEIAKALEFCESGKVKVDITTWNRRYREYMETINTGELMEIARVFRCLTVLRQMKDLSFGERKMLDLAKELIESERLAA